MDPTQECQAAVAVAVAAGLRLSHLPTQAVRIHSLSAMEALEALGPMQADQQVQRAIWVESAVSAMRLLMFLSYFQADREAREVA
jgi:hypothetical protein